MYQNMHFKHFNLFNFFLKFSGDITQKGYEKKRSKLLLPFLEEKEAEAKREAEEKAAAAVTAAKQTTTAVNQTATEAETAETPIASTSKTQQQQLMMTQQQLLTQQLLTQQMILNSSRSGQETDASVTPPARGANTPEAGAGRGGGRDRGLWGGT